MVWILLGLYVDREVARVFFARKWLRWLFFYHNPRVDRILAEVVSDGQRERFPEMPISGVTIRGLWDFPQGWHAICYSNDAGSIIFVHLRGPALGRKLNDQALRILLAHEYGHAVGHASRRGMHPFLDRIAHLGGEAFADAVAAYLYGQESVQGMCRDYDLAETKVTRGQVELVRPVRFRQ